MRYITKYSQHIYTTKSSAVRAARNAVGRTYMVDSEELRNRFDGTITVTNDIIIVVAREDGWRWAYTFSLSDVVVHVRNADGSFGEVRYAEVAHWKDACTPCDNLLHEIGQRVAAFRRDCEAAEDEGTVQNILNSAVLKIQQMCRKAGVVYEDVLGIHSRADRALLSYDPIHIAEAIVMAAPYGLASFALHLHLLRMAARRGCSSLECLFLAGKKLSEAAV